MSGVCQGQVMFNQSEISCSVIRLITSSPDSLLSFCSSFRPLFCSFDLKKTRKLTFHSTQTFFQNLSCKVNAPVFFKLLLIKSSVTFLRARVDSSPFCVCTFFSILQQDKIKTANYVCGIIKSLKQWFYWLDFFPLISWDRGAKALALYCNLPPSMTDHILGLVWTGFLI